MVLLMNGMFGSSSSSSSSSSSLRRINSKSINENLQTRPPFSMWFLSRPFNNDIILNKDNIFVMSLEETTTISSNSNATFNDTLIDQLLNTYNITVDSLNENQTHSLFENSTSNDLMMSEQMAVLLRMILLSVVLGLMILVTIIGNVFVIAAIILERNLQNVANYLVVSLAVADLFVACLVMPLGAVYEINEGWILGSELCDIWTSCDVLCCTASILHLVAIATDRYWTVTNIDYHNLRTPRRIFSMVFLVWFFAIIVALAPQFGWKDPEYLLRIERQRCMVSQDVIYQIFATCCSFYVPLLMILVLYWKIYKIARKRIKRRTQRLRQSARNQHKDSIMESTVKKSPKICFNTDLCDNKKDTTTILSSTTVATSAATTTIVTSASIAAPSEASYSTNSNLNVREETEFSTSNFDSKSHATDLTTVSDENTTTLNEDPSSFAGEICTVSHQVAVTTSTFQRHVTAIILSSVSPRFALAGITGKQQTTDSTSRTNTEQKLAKRRQQIEARRERKAAQTLAIITGAFVVCWLPFFVMALLLSLCKTCEIPMVVTSLFLWLGYFNSTLNPIIYTVFNPEFRRAFQRLLFGKKTSITTITMTAANTKTPIQIATQMQMQTQTSNESQKQARRNFSKRRKAQKM